jgi:hypothetical protein
MKIRSSLLQLATLLLFASGAESPSTAQPIGTFCPPAGTIYQGTSNRGPYTSTSKGADPKDPTICLRVTEGPGAGVNYGKQVATLYGWYQSDYFSAAQLAKARAELGALFAGQKDQTTFDITVNRPGTSYVWTDTVTWKRMGQEMITIGGRPINAVRFEYHDVGGPGSGSYDTLWSLWYDPTSHVWIKGDIRNFGGPLQISFQVTSISSP